MPKVNVPKGCFGLEFPDGSKPDADRNGKVEVSDEQAKTIGKSWYAGSDVVSASERMSFGTKNTALCPKCNKKWNAWTKVCHSCGTETVVE